MNYKIDPRPLVTLILVSIAVAIILIAISSCSGKWYYGKAIKKGVRCETTTDTITIRSIDSMIVNGEKTYYYTSKDTVIHFNTVYVPKTRYETRYEFKTLHDTLKLVKYIEKQKAKNERRDDKNSFGGNFRLLLIILVLLALIYLAFKFIPK
jgi:hydroxylamine reductase (hybrid-cluster protein)